MSSSDNSHLLTKNEIIIFNYLKNSKQKVFSLDELENSIPLNRDSTLQSLYLLEERKYLQLNKEIKEYYCLSKEAIDYCINEFPERRLILEISNFNSISISILKKRYSDSLLKIALSWITRKKWGSLKDGNLILTKKNIEYGMDEIILKKIYENNKEKANSNLCFEINVFDYYKYEKDKTINLNETLSLLEKRKLLIKVKKLNYYFSINKDLDKIYCSNINNENEINNINHEFITSKKWINNHNYKKYNIKKPNKKIFISKIHPYQRLIDDIRDIFLEMGFQEMDGNIIQNSFWNFDALFQPQDHPAREMQDTFYLNSYEKCLPESYLNVKYVHENGVDEDSRGWGNKWDEKIAKQKVLRTHTTSISIQYLASNPEGSYKKFCIARAYRRESVDSTHTSEFEQLEGIVKSEEKNVTFSNLLYYLKEFYHNVGFDEIRFRPGYFPYTEPSIEPEVYVDGIGWIELGGAGILREEVLKPLNISGNVLAWGLGISRIAMLKLGLQDLRRLYQADIKWIQEKKSI